MRPGQATAGGGRRARYHVFDHEMPRGEGDGVGWRGHRQHEGVGAAYGGRDHEVERVDRQSDGLTETKTRARTFK